MSNHIKVKFFSFAYSPVPSEKFSERLSELADQLRRYFPRNEAPSMKGFQIQINDGGVATQQVEEVQRELHMVDAQGLWAVKIGNSGVSFSTAKYVSYDDSITYIETIVGVITDVLGVYHFSHVSLRNINLFDHRAGNDNQFEDIKNGEYWGRQEFETLQTGFICNGASTRHVYFSHDYKTQMQLSSGIVLKGQSPIPQEEWPIWKLRGSVPVQNESVAMLLVDINGSRHEAPFNNPEQQNNVSEYTWEAVKQSFDELHEVVNSVYFDITTKD